MKPAISLCMIVRNEEGNLTACLSDVKNLFDEIVIVDTGSIDSTRSIAQGLGAKVYDFPWVDDFSAARNECRRRATGQWVMWMDADDRIDAENCRRLNELFQSLDSFDVRSNPIFQMACQWRPCGARFETRLIQSRLFANASKISWQRPIHEDLVPESPDVRLSVRFVDVAIQHTGYSDPAVVARKQFRDRCILEREFLLNPEDPITLYYLARLNLNERRCEESLRLARRAVAVQAGGPTGITSFAYEIAAESLAQLGRRAEAIVMCDQGLARFPGHLPLLYKRGALLHDTGRLLEAEQCFRRILSDPRPRAAQGAGVTMGTDDDRTRLSLASTLLRLGRWADGAAVLREQLQLAPKCLEAWEMLGYLNLMTNQRREFEAVLQGMAACPNSEMERAVLHAQRYVLDKVYDEARIWIDRAIKAQPGAVAPLIVLADLLYQEGRDPQRCIEIHRRVLSMDPTRDEIRSRLASLMAQPAPLNSIVAQPAGSARQIALKNHSLVA